MPPIKFIFFLFLFEDYVRSNWERSVVVIWFSLYKFWWKILCVKRLFNRSWKLALQRRSQRHMGGQMQQSNAAAAGPSTMRSLLVAVAATPTVMRSWHSGSSPQGCSIWPFPWPPPVSIIASSPISSCR